MNRTIFKIISYFFFISTILLFFVLTTHITLAAIIDCYCGTDGLGYCYVNCRASATEIDGWSCTWDSLQGDYWCCHSTQDDSWGQDNCPGYCDPGCTPSACWTGTSTSGAYGYYGATECTDDCGDKEYRYCYCSSECTPGGCPSGTSTTDSKPTSPLYPISSDYHSTPSCDNDCNYTSYGSECYCPLCTPPACAPLYELTSQGYGQVLDSNTPSCRRGYPDTPDYANKCNMTYRTCYCKPFKNCPSPLLNLNNLNPNLKLEDFRRSTNACGVSPNETNDDCYEVESPQPTETFSIVDSAVPLNKYDFKDQSMFPYSHTGQYDASNFPEQGDLNDPTDPIEMIATYTDQDGVNDIEGMFVWFRHESLTEPYGMPVHISSSATPQGSAQNSWGFMLRDTISGWEPYVASFQSTPAVWTPASGTSTIFYLPDPNQRRMIEVTIKDITENTPAKTITLKFSLRFTNEGGPFEPLALKATEGKYKILLMGLDRFSFTPFDNYTSEPLIDDGDFWDITYLLNGEDFTYYWKSNQLRYIDGVQDYARLWTDTNKTWTLDFTDPYFNPNTTLGFTKEVIENNVKISWDVRDNQNLFAIVGNIYVDGTNQKPLTLFDETDGVTLRGSEIYPLGPDDMGTLIGKLVKDDLNSRTWSFKVNPNLSTDSHTGSVTIGVGNNTVGNLIVWLTVFDDAGNVARTSISQGLSDKFLTGGGLVFSPTNNFSTLPLPNDATNWTNILPPYSSSPSEGLIKGNAGFTSEMYANSGEPSNSGVAESFGISNFTRWIRTTPPETPPLYDSLKRKYELHKKYINPIEQNLTSPIGGPVPLPGCPASGAYCTYFREGIDAAGDLTINPNLICNKQALIFVQRDLIITPPLLNTTSPADSLSNFNGCIFVVGGTVTIAANPALNGTFSYDRINAFIVSDGVITIAHDPDSTTIVDGVYINGGLISRGGADSIDILRYLRLQERLVYPVFAIDLHPKYGILGEKFFGNSYVIQSTEVGLKPY